MAAKKFEKVPKHLAIIPDGNRRWARQRNLPVFKGHEAGLKKFREILEWCRESGIRAVTLYTFSLENFQRDKKEVAALMKIIGKELNRLASDKKVHAEKVKVQIIGELSLLPPAVKAAALKCMEATKKYSSYTLNLAIAYGGRAEIVHAVQEIALQVEKKKMKIKEINERSFAQHLYGDLPDVDLILRTSENRISGFLPWQGTYAEIMFLPNVLFPDFSRNDFMNVLEEFSSKERRFGA